MRNLKKQLEARRDVDRKRKKELVDAIVGPETYAAIERVQAELKTIDEQIKLLPPPHFVYAGANYFPRVGYFSSFFAAASCLCADARQCAVSR